MKINQILVPVAPDQTSFEKIEEVFKFAEPQAAQITFISIVEEMNFDRIGRYLNESPYSLLEKAKALELEKLEGIQSEMQEKYPKVTTKTLVDAGIAFIKIIEHAAEYDLIAIDPTRQGKRDLAQAGSVTRHLLRKAQVPVWCLGQKRFEETKRIAATIDLSDKEENIAFNKKIIDSAVSFAKSSNSELIILHAWSLPGEGYLRSWGRKSNLEIAQLADRECKAREIEINEYLSDITYDQIQVKLIEGHPKEVIPKFVESEEIDILIIGTVARTNIAGFIIGNTAETVLNSVNCPIVTLKPDHFRSPVL